MKEFPTDELLMENFANLHTHTRFSDGSISATELVGLVQAEPGLECFALTDHDSLSGIEPVFRALEHIGPDRPAFIPGIELSLEEKSRNLSIHLLGYFPWINDSNCRRELARVDSVLGAHCRTCCLDRGYRDVELRVRQAFKLNLEDLAERFAGPEEIIGLLYGRAREKSDEFGRSEGKAGDVIDHPIPATYNLILDHWQELFPQSTRERISLYILRPSSERKARLTEIFITEDGLDQDRAAARADQLQGCLINFARPPSSLPDPLAGLALLKQTGAVCVLAHPAAELFKIDSDGFDRLVTIPMIKEGLDGIEGYYPYGGDSSEQIWNRYLHLAVKNGLLITGGTDFHGDGRTGLADVLLPLERASALASAGSYLGANHD